MTARLRSSMRRSVSAPQLSTSETWTKHKVTALPASTPPITPQASSPPTVSAAAAAPGTTITSMQAEDLTSTSAHEMVAATPFRILDLPRKLRDMIWSLAVARNNRQRTLRNGTQIEKLDSGRLPALLHASHQLREEAGECYFSQHTFFISGQHQSGRFLELLAISNFAWSSFVKNVVLMMDHFEPEASYSSKRSNSARDSLSRIMHTYQDMLGLGDGVVWFAVRKIATKVYGPQLEYGPQKVYEVVGDGGRDDLREIAVGWYEWQGTNAEYDEWDALRISKS